MYTLRSGFKKLADTSDYFRRGNMKKGELLLAHVHCVEQIVQEGAVLVKAKCVSQVNDNVVYDVEFELSWSCPQKRQLRICTGKRTCKAGVQGHCKHAAAVCFFINTHEEQSFTSQPQQWGKRSRKRQSEDVIDMLPSQKARCPDVKPASRSVLLEYPEISCPLKEVLELTTLNADELIRKEVLDDVVERASKANERELLEAMLAAMLTRPVYRYLEVLEDEKTQEKDFLSELSADQAQKYHSEIFLHGKVADLPILTEGQANCARWHVERRLRISASKAHTIVIKKHDDGLRKAVQQLSKATTYASAAMRYGIKTEGPARFSLEKKLEARIVQTGLVVLPQQPWLCCSPDGLVKIGNETVLIEITCTFKFKDTPFVNYEERICHLPYLTFTDCTITLKETNQYYTQIQVSLYVLNLQKALLYVYSPKQFVIVRVTRDERFLWEVIPKMERFYFKFFIPAIF